MGSDDKSASEQDHDDTSDSVEITEKKKKTKKSSRTTKEDQDPIDLKESQSPSSSQGSSEDEGDDDPDADHGEVSPELKASGQRRKVGLRRRVFGRKSNKHVPKWHVYPTVLVQSPADNGTKGFPTNKIGTTKYTFYNFLPKNLFEQFRRATNVYFLVITTITFIPVISPLTPVTSLMPLLFVLLVTAAKEAYEDFLRFKADRKVNGRVYTVMEKDGSKKQVQSAQLKVGDMVKLDNNQPAPADMVLLATALQDGLCYVDTAQLDGESNLKRLMAVKQTAGLSEEDLVKLKGKVECEEPHDILDTFNARMSIGDDKLFSVGSSQLLLRGTNVRNTAWAIGIIVYGGRDTKLSLNQKEPPSKFSKLENKLNVLVAGIFTFKFIATVVCTIFSLLFQATQASDMWYLDEIGQESPALTATKDFFAYFVLLSFLIPMSMMVTLEIVKFGQATFMEWDVEMRTVPSDPSTGMEAKTSNLNDELALVKYIFSDKTGTLTQNKMEFSKASIQRVSYSKPNEGELKGLLEEHKWKFKQTGGKAQPIADFLLNLAVCHSVVVEHDPASGEIIYQAQSPDEAALCKAAKNNGFTFKSNTSEGLVVEILGTDTTFEILNTIEFSSKRARMTVVARLPDGTIRVFAKGSDAMMIPRLKSSTDKLFKETKVHMNDYSNEGLRILLVAQKDISESEYKAWNKKYEAAANSLHHRAEKLDVVSEELENNFQLVGCTAIEDRLQDGVPETIHYLLEAGIKIWVITGDKQETAINIGYSTRLINDTQTKIILNVDISDERKKKSKSPTAQLKDMLDKAFKDHIEEKKDYNLALVIDGATLVHALAEHSERFYELATCCKSVVCCRVTPLQKALIVRLVKSKTGDVCLAIGDGANDVSMIQEAQIGVGIRGNEGAQAVRASDYALQQFSHLKRLIVVHGRYSMIRNAACIYSSLYKNLAFFFVQVWFAFVNGASSQTVYDDYIVTSMNIVFSAAPPFFLGIFEKDIREDILEKQPKSYLFVQSGKAFTYSSVVLWLTSAFFHSLISYGTGWILFHDDAIFSDGTTGGLWVMAVFVSAIGVTIILHKILLETRYWTWVTLVFHFVSLLFFPLVYTAISVMPSYWPVGYNVFQTTLSTPTFYFTAVIAIGIALLPDIAAKYLRRQFWPQPWMILQEQSLSYAFASKNEVEML